MKKLLIGLGTVIAVATPFATVVSYSSLKSSILENNKNDSSQIREKHEHEPNTETVVEKTNPTDTNASKKTITKADSVDNKKMNHTLLTHFNNIEDIIKAFKTTKIHSSSS